MKAISKLAIGCAMALVSAWAVGQTTLPFKAVPSEVAIEHPEVGRSVILAVQFSCPHCRRTHPVMSRWLSSLPGEVNVELLPVMTGAQGVGAARGYYAVRTIDESKVDPYVAALYAAVHDGAAGVDQWETHVAVAEQIGIEAEQFRRAWHDRSVYSALLRAAALNDALALEAVPALVVFGQYQLTPADVDGNIGVLLQVASGLISQRVADQ